MFPRKNTSGKLFHWQRGGGVTLLEILVLTTILIILLTLSLPAIFDFQNRGKALGCISNLRKLFVGISLYAGDHNGRLPPAQDAYPPTPGANYWFRHPDMWARKYVASNQAELKKILRCPSDKTPSSRDDYKSYGHVPHFLQHWAFGEPQWQLNGQRYVLLGEVSRRVLLMDGVTTEPFGAQGAFPPTVAALSGNFSDRHSLKGNALFGDGSIKAVSKEEVLEKRSKWFDSFSTP